MCTAANTFRRMVNRLHKLPVLQWPVPSIFPRRNNSYGEFPHQQLRLPRSTRHFPKPRPPRPASSRRMGSRQHCFFLRRPIEDTIFGQSSGSVAVSYWPYAYPTDHIVAGLIAHSGDAFSFPVNKPELVARNWYNASALLGCGAEGDVMDCTRNLDFEDIKVAAAKVPPPPNTSEARSQPAF